MATAEAVTVEENHWYHLAATSDGENLKLYVDSLDGKGYLLWAVTGLPTTGSAALARRSLSDQGPLCHSAGRGLSLHLVGRPGLLRRRLSDYGSKVGSTRFAFAMRPWSTSEFLFTPQANTNRAKDRLTEKMVTEKK